MNVPAPVAGIVFLVLALLVLDGPEWLGRADSTVRLRRLALDAWGAGVLAAHLFLVGALGRSDRGLEATAREMALAFVPALIGLAIAAVAGMRAFARAKEAVAEAENGGARPAAPELAPAAAFALLVAAGLAAATHEGGEARLAPLSILLHPPALLAAAGLALLFLRLAGRGAERSALVPAIALAGLLAGLAGLLQALAGLGARDLERVTAGLAFLLTGGFAALCALLAAARLAEGGRAGGAAVAHAVARALLPLAALLFLAFAFVVVLTPMTAPG